MKVAIITSNRSVSLKKVAKDIELVARKEFGMETVFMEYPRYEPSEIKTLSGAVTVMTFDPIWVTPFTWFCRELRLEGVKCVFYTTVEGNIKKVPSVEWMFRDLDYVANSKYTASKMRLAGARVVDVVHHGINVDEAQAFSWMREEVRAKLGVSNNEFLVGYVAAGYRRKGHRLFANVAKEVSKSDPSIRVAVITDDRGAQSYSDVQDAIVVPEFGKLGKHIIYGFYHAVDAYVQASLAEGFGLPVLEALACGKLVVHPDYDPLSEITTSETSIRVPVVSVDYTTEMGSIEYELHIYNPSDMVKAILDAKRIVSEKREEIAKKAVERAKKFNFVEQYSKLLNNLLRSQSL